MARCAGAPVRFVGNVGMSVPVGTPAALTVVALLAGIAAAIMPRTSGLATQRARCPALTSQGSPAGRAMSSMDGAHGAIAARAVYRNELRGGATDQPTPATLGG
jgi:hypothetical protein